MALCYDGTDVHRHGYVDFDFASDVDNQKSTTGIAPSSRDTYPDTCPDFFDHIVLIFFQYLFLSCDCLCYLVSDLDSQT